jgi:uncharacterized membrane protein
MRKIPAFTVAIAAIMIAVTFVFTKVVNVPIPGTSEYLNFSDVAINFTALAFGPWLGLIAGALGPAIADLFGWPQWAPLTLFAHGLQGLVVGLLGYGKSGWRLFLAWLAGTVIMVGIYLLGAGLVISGWGDALFAAPLRNSARFAYLMLRSRAWPSSQ